MDIGRETAEEMSSMTSLFTSTKIRLEAAQAVECGFMLCGQAVIGMKPATQHAVNPRDMGGLAL